MVLETKIRTVGMLTAAVVSLPLGSPAKRTRTHLLVYKLMYIYISIYFFFYIYLFLYISIYIKWTYLYQTKHLFILMSPTLIHCHKDHYSFLHCLSVTMHFSNEKPVSTIHHPLFNSNTQVQWFQSNPYSCGKFYQPQYSSCMWFPLLIFKFI